MHLECSLSKPAQVFDSKGRAAIRASGGAAGTADAAGIAIEIHAEGAGRTWCGPTGTFIDAARMAGLGDCGGAASGSFGGNGSGSIHDPKGRYCLSRKSGAD